jgi:hypothetical protein
MRTERRGEERGERREERGEERGERREGRGEERGERREGSIPLTLSNTCIIILF